MHAVSIYTWVVRKFAEFRFFVQYFLKIALLSANQNFFVYIIQAVIFHALSRLYRWVVFIIGKKCGQLAVIKTRKLG